MITPTILTTVAMMVVVGVEPELDVSDDVDPTTLALI